MKWSEDLCSCYISIQAQMKGFFLRPPSACVRGMRWRPMMADDAPWMASPMALWGGKFPGSQQVSAGHGDLHSDHGHNDQWSLYFGPRWMCLCRRKGLRMECFCQRRWHLSKSGPAHRDRLLSVQYTGEMRNNQLSPTDRCLWLCSSCWLCLGHGFRNVPSCECPDRLSGVSHASWMQFGSTSSPSEWLQPVERRQGCWGAYVCDVGRYLAGVNVTALWLLGVLADFHV